jgi:hypothetical protein
MVQLWQKRLVRLVGLAAGGSLLALVLTSCTFYPVTVNSVTATYVPNPPVGGIPAEQVDFTIHGSHTGGFVRLVQVFNNSGKLVGSTVLNGLSNGKSTQEVSDAIPVKGNNFNGTASNASVKCGQQK